MSAEEPPAASRNPLDFIRNKFLRDAATLQVSGTLNQASQLISSIVIAFLLGAVGQGRYALAVMLQGLFYNVVNVGAMQATVSQLAAASARENKGKFAAWMAFLAKFNLTFNAALIGLGYFVLPELAEWWYDDRQLGVWAWWLTLWPLIDTPRAVAFAACQGTRRMLPLAQIENGGELLRAYLVTMGAVITHSPAGAVLGEIAARTIASLVAVVLYRRARLDGGTFLPTLREVWRQMPAIPLRQGMPFSFRVGILKNANALFLNVFPRLLIGATAGAAWVAYFHIAQRIMGLPMMLMQGVSRTILPALSEMAGVRDLSRFKGLYYKTTLTAGVVISSGILLCLPLIQPIVSRFFPDDYAKPVFLYSCILAVGFVPMSFAVGLESFYIVSDRLRVSLILSALGCIVLIPVNFVLIRLYPQTGRGLGPRGLHVLGARALRLRRLVLPPRAQPAALGDRLICASSS